MLPSTLKHLYSVEPVRMHFLSKQPCTNDTVCNAAIHSNWFKGIEVLQGRRQHGEKVGYCYPSGLEKTLCKWDIYVPLVTKELKLPDQLWSLQILLVSAYRRPFFLDKSDGV